MNGVSLKIAGVGCSLLAACSAGAALSSQSVDARYFWYDDATAATQGTCSDTIYVYNSTPTGTVSAILDPGVRVASWWRQTKTSLKVSDFSLISEGGNTLSWTMDDDYGNVVHLGLRLTYISYALNYVGGSSTNLLYTNELTIAACETVRAGYTFGNAWTDDEGQSHAVGSTVTGADFNITNHDDTAVVNLTPVWTAHAFSVRFHANGGTGAMSDQSFVYDEAQTLSPNTFARTGYTFQGWALTSGGAVKYKDRESVKNMTSEDGGVFDVYAVWSVNTYALSVSAVGNGTVSTSPSGSTFDFCSTVTLTATPGNAGTTFTKWTDGNTENPRTVQIPANDTSYVAVFTTASYTVNWYDNSRWGTLLKTETVSWGEDASAPEHPQHDGYTPTGWTGDGRTIKANTMIYATYDANWYQLKLNANDGGKTAEIPIDCRYGEPLTLPKNTFVQKGYSFLGWGTNATAKTAVYSDGATVVSLSTGAAITLYAVWQPNAYVVSFAPNGGTGEMASQDFVYDVAQNLTLNAFVNGERDFLGWRDDQGIVYADGQLVSNLTDTAGGTVTLTARWAGTYHVAFDGNGATSGTMASQTFTDAEDQRNLTANAYAKTGYAFVGWSTNVSDAAANKIFKADGALVKGLAEPGTTLTLYASWKAITYCVAFSAGEGVTEKELSVVKVTYDQSFQLPIATNGNYRASDPDLYTFGGWTNLLQGAAYGDRAVVSNLCTRANATNTLVAVWALDAGDWSRHLHCTTLRWSIVNSAEEYTKWQKQEGADLGGAAASTCAFQEGTGSLNDHEWLSASVRTNGTLTFSCRCRGNPVGSPRLCVGFSADNSNFYYTSADRRNLYVTSTEWTSFEIPVTNNIGTSGMTMIHLVVMGSKDILELDNVRWTPEGGSGGAEPQPGVDNPSVTGISFENGKIVIRSTGDARFGYQVLSTSTLSPPDWKVVSESYQAGQGEGQEFTLPIVPSEPMKFYKVEVLQKK